MSGGIVWVPNNPVMRADGVPDSYEDAMAHFEAVVGDVGPASSFERRHAFLTAGPEMVSFLQERGVRFVYCPGYSDYYSSAKGGHDIGRGIEPVPFDGHVLGEWLEKLQPGLAQEPRPRRDDERGALALPLQPQHRRLRGLGPRRAPDLCRPAATSGTAHERRLADRADAADRARPRDPGLDGGAARGPDRRGRPRRRRSHRSQQASPVLVRARQGVLLASGGFAHNPEMRERVRRRPAQPGAVVDRQPGRHRRGHPGRDAASAPRPT